MTRVISVLTVAVWLWSAATFAATPPGGSRSATGSHPMLIVTQANRAAMLTYITTYYHEEFQEFLDLLGTGIAVGSQDKQVENVMGPVNYAFLAALGTTAIANAGFSLPAAYDTDAEACARAYYYMTTAINNGTSVCTAGAPCAAPLDDIKATVGLNQSASVNTWFMRRTGSQYYLPTTLAADWCWPLLSAPQKTAIADAYYELYQEQFQGQDLLGGQLFAQAFPTMSNRWAGQMDALLFGPVVYADTSVLDGTKRGQLYDTFYTIFVNRYLWEIDKLAPTGWNFIEGAEYWSYSYGVLNTLFFAAVDPALGTTYLHDRPYFTDAAAGQTAWVWPETLGRRTTGCGAGADTACDPLVEPWGENSNGGGSLNQGQCRAAHLTLGLDRYRADIEGDSAFTAGKGIARWTWDNYINIGSSTPYCFSPGNDSISSGTIWGMGVFFWFIFGTEGVTPVAPTDPNLALGQGYFILRKNYTQSDTYIFFGGAEQYGPSAHDARHYGDFTLRKYGPLVTSYTNWRGGLCQAGNITGGSYTNNALRSNVGVHTGASDPPTENGAGAGSFSVNDPDFYARGITGVGYLMANATLHSFSASDTHIRYDADPYWTEASKMIRDFVYLRGEDDHEQILVYDTVNVASASNVPYWKLWVPVKPACEDGSAVPACTANGSFEWTTDGVKVSVTNNNSGLDLVGTFPTVLPPASGKLYVTALSPSDIKLRLRGDDGTHAHAYRDGDGNQVPMDSTACSAGFEQLYGWGRIEGYPNTVSTGNDSDLNHVGNRFLFVLQFGNSSTLTEADTWQRAANGDDNRFFAYIGDTRRNKLIGLARINTLATEGYRYTYPQTTPTSYHVQMHLTPGQTYWVSSTRGIGQDMTVAVSASPDFLSTPYTADHMGDIRYEIARPAVLMTALEQ